MCAVICHITCPRATSPLRKGERTPLLLTTYTSGLSVTLRQGGMCIVSRLKEDYHFPFPYSPCALAGALNTFVGHRLYGPGKWDGSEGSQKLLCSIPQSVLWGLTTEPLRWGQNLPLLTASQGIQS